MAIKNIKARLEGSYRLIRIKRIKNIFFIIQLIIGLVLGLVISYLLEMNLNPLYFPVGTFSFIFLILVLIISIEAIYFKGLEIKYTRNKSRRFLLARNAIRRSIVIISITGLLILMLLLPYTQDTILETHTPGMPITDFQIEPLNHTRQTFMSQDSFGLVSANSIRFTANGPCSIRIEKDGTPIWNPDSGETTYSWSGLGERAAPRHEMVLFVENQNPNTVTFNYSIGTELSPFITTYLPAMGLGFIIIQFIAISIMYPIRETYASSSIYSKKYVAKTDTGEYSISDRELTRKYKEEQALLDSTLDIEVQPIPHAKKAVAPPPPEDVEMARVKGRVDENLIEEPDVKCTNCGAMNSADSAICYSCGEELQGAVKRTIDTEAYLSKGMKFASAGKYEDAISCYDEVLKYENTNEKTLVQKGLALFKLGKWGSAVQYVNTTLKLNQNNIEALLLKAEILEDRDRLEKSMMIYSQILSIDPDNAIAKSKMEQVSEEAAMEDVEDVLEQFMCLPGIGLARATALYEAGFTSMAALKGASENDLIRIKGISKGLAKKIRKNLESQ